MALDVLGRDCACSFVLNSTVFHSQKPPRLSDLIKSTGGGLRPIVWVGIGLAVFQQLVGINVIFYYGAVMWEAAGFTEADALKQNVFTGALVDGSLQLSDNMGRLSLYAAMAYVFFFNMTWGPVMWVMLGEMFPNQIRGSALAVAGFAQWIANFVVTLTFPIMLGTIGLAASFGIYSAFAFISILFVAKAVTETKGMELEDMVG